MLVYYCEFIFGPNPRADSDKGALDGPPASGTVGRPRMQTELVPQTRPASPQVVQFGSQSAEDSALLRSHGGHRSFDRHWSHFEQGMAAAGARQSLTNHCRLAPDVPARVLGPCS